MEDRPDTSVPAGATRGRPGWASIRRHPVVAGTLVACTLAGAVLGFVYLTGDWSAARRLAAGAVGGAGFGLLLTATKMLAE